MSDISMNRNALTVKITNSVVLKGSLIVPEKVGTSYETHTKYEGEYEITPTVNGETLQTKEKYFENDLTIKPIPIYETTNNSGGLTVYIAKE